MRRIFPFLALLALTSLPLFSAEAKWQTNYEVALKQASTEKKPLVIDFTGSDWCGWCIRLDKEVFSQPAFVSYAGQKLVLLKVDFPRKTQLPEAQAAKNKELARNYRVRGYPSIIVLDPAGKQIGQLGYEKGGPKVWLAELEKITLPAPGSKP